MPKPLSPLSPVILEYAVLPQDDLPLITQLESSFLDMLLFRPCPLIDGNR